MKKYLIILCFFLSKVYAQNGNHIHHLYGLSEPVPGLFRVAALNQQKDRDVEIETFSLSFNLGGEYMYNTVNNNVFFLDSTSQTTPSVLNSYFLPDLYSSNYIGAKDTFNYQTVVNNICIDLENDTSLFYAFDADSNRVIGIDFIQGADFSSPVLNFNNAISNNLSFTYFNNSVIIGSNVGNEYLIYNLNSADLSIIDSSTYLFEFIYFTSQKNLGTYAVAQNAQNQHYLLKYLINQSQFDTIGLLPSCQNCAAETFLYDKNAMVIDGEKEQLILSRTEIIGGVENYYLSTFSLTDASLVYNTKTAERWSNLIFQKPMDDLVYPGDANHDKVVNMLDILPIGLKYNELDSARNEISTAFIGQDALNTGDTLISGVDKKHADCNGDGQINVLDIDEGILPNYTYFHNSEKSTTALCQFPLYVNFPSMVKEGDDIEVEIGLDLSANALQNVYGVVFTIEYDTNFVVENTLNTQGINAWFGTENGNYVQRYKDNYTVGKMDVGVVGIDKINKNGGGGVVKSIWTMEDVVIPITQNHVDMRFNIKDVTIIDLEENVLDACGLDTVIKVYNKTVGIKERKILSLNIYPNPIKADFINLAYVDELESVEIYDLQGKMLNTWTHNFEQLNISEYAKGIYILKAYAKEKIYVNKLVYEKQ